MKNRSSSDALMGEVRWPKRVVTAADAVRFIDSVGYCLLFPILGLPLPSLYYACARRDLRLGPNWDTYTQRIWKWKDEFGRRRCAFYSRYFKGRGTFISVKLLPHFLAMEESAYGEEEFGRAYTAGRITADARVVWEALAAHGPLATLELRHACKFETRPGNRRFKKAMLQLSRLLLVVHSGSEQETEAWASSRFELAARAFPEALLRARRMEAGDARRVLAEKYMEWHPAADARTLARLFRWSRAEAVAARGDGGRR